MTFRLAGMLAGVGGGQEKATGGQVRRERSVGPIRDGKGGEGKAATGVLL